MQNKDIIPAGTISFKEFPEKILLQGKNYPIQIHLKNNSETKQNPVDFFLKYRINGFKIVEIPDNLKSEVWFSMPADLEYDFSLKIEPSIEGPLQFEISMFGKKINYSQEEKIRKIKVEVEKKIGPEESDIPVLRLADIRCEFCKHYSNGECKLTSTPVESTFKCENFLLIENMRLESDFPIIKKVIEERDEKYIEEKFDTEEILVDSKAIYMEAINAGTSTNLEKFMTLGDVSSNIANIKASTIIFYFPIVIRPEYTNFLREINKKMFQTSGNTFLYLNFPISQTPNESEFNVIREGINKFLPKIQHLDSKIIFNLDFIPKSEKPIIILGRDDKGTAQEIQKVLLSGLGNQKCDIILDSNIFSGGTLFERISSFCSNVKADIVNLILSEHFREDHSLFLDFLNIFSK